MMSYLRGQPAPFANRNRLFDALQNPSRFVAHVRDVDASESASDSRQLDDLVSRREVAGHIEQPRAEPNAPSFIPCSTSARIFSSSSAVRLTIGVTDHRRADSALANKASDVD